MARKIEFRVEGMSCQGCVKAVQMAIDELPGILSREVSLEKAKATVTYDENQVQPQAILAALKETPYEISVMDERQG